MWRRPGNQGGSFHPVVLSLDLSQEAAITGSAPNLFSCRASTAVDRMNTGLSDGETVRTMRPCLGIEHSKRNPSTPWTHPMPSGGWHGPISPVRFVLTGAFGRSGDGPTGFGMFPTEKAGFVECFRLLDTASMVFPPGVLVSPHQKKCRFRSPSDDHESLCQAQRLPGRLLAPGIL